MKEKWLSFPKRENLGNLDLLEMMDSQEKEVIKEHPGCKGEEESQEDMDHLDFTEGNLVRKVSQGLLDPQALQAQLV